MSYKSSQPSPSSTRSANLRVPIHVHWSSPRLNYHKVDFSRSWLIYDPEVDVLRQVNRDVILGMALVFVVSASIWTGIGLAITQLWK